MNKKCEARKKNGARCTADSQLGKDDCVFHDPARIKDGHRARRAGGINRSRSSGVLPLDAPDHPLAKSADISVLLADSINQLLRGQLDPRVANAIGYLVSVQLRSFDQSALDDRMTKIEATMGLIARPMFHLREELIEEEENDEKPQKSA
jgi:hypothetical protein